MTDFEDNIQGSISFHDDATAQFRLLWTIKEYEKVKQSVRHQNYISTKLPVNVLPGQFSCGIKLYPHGDSSVTDTAGFASVFIYNSKGKPFNTVWVSCKLALLDRNSKEKYVMFEGPRKLFARESCGYPQFFPKNPEVGTATLTPNGCLQILVEGIVWAEEPVNKITNIFNFKDCSVTSVVALYQSEKYSDATISVGDEKFQVHKNILSSKSSVFQEMFETSSQNIIVIPDIRDEVFREVINFVYTDTVTATFETILPEVLIVAKKYELNYLAEICQDKMLKNLCLGNCLEFVQVADSCGASQLKGKSLDFITKNRKLVFNNEKWKVFRSKFNALHLELLERCMNQD